MFRVAIRAGSVQRAAAVLNLTLCHACHSGQEGFGSLLNLVGYTAIKDTGIISVKTKVVPVFAVPVLNSPIF